MHYFGFVIGQLSCSKRWLPALQYVFNLGVQFENLLKLARQGGAVYCLLYRAHVGRFDTTCAASNWKPQTGKSMYVERVEDRRNEDGKELLPRVAKKTTIKCGGDVTRRVNAAVVM